MFGYFIVKSSFDRMNIIWIVSFKLTFRYVVTELFLNFILSFLKYSMVRVLVENLN